MGLVRVEIEVVVGGRKEERGKREGEKLEHLILAFFAKSRLYVDDDDEESKKYL